MDNIKSPCTGKCSVNNVYVNLYPRRTPVSGCGTCLRTLTEIQDWNQYSDAEKFRVISNLPKRA